MQNNIFWTDALVQFHAPDQSLTSLHQKALLREGPLEPALHTKRKRLVDRSAELRQKAQELDATLEVWFHVLMFYITSRTHIGTLSAA